MYIYYTHAYDVFDNLWKEVISQMYYDPKTYNNQNEPNAYILRNHENYLANEALLGSIKREASAIDL